MIGSISGFSDDRLSLYIDFKVPHNFKGGETVNVSVNRSKRSIKQNNFYFCLLAYALYSTDTLRRQGHFSVTGLHEDCKAYISETFDKDYKEGFSTADFGILEFKDYFDIAEREFLNKELCVNTAPFFALYQEFVEWRLFQDDQEAATFRVFLEERAK